MADASPYDNPLITRYAGAEMVALWGPQRKHSTWRRLWLALAEVAPKSRPIIHLGAASCYVTDNTDLLLMREGLGMVRDRLVGVIDALARFAEKWRDLATLGFTHFQPAQLTTVGKRACLWCYDFVLDLQEIDQRLGLLRFRGAKGATGTQASFLRLFRGDHAKVRDLD